MLNQNVVVRDPKGEYYGKQGIVVVVSSSKFDNPYNQNEVLCKILIDDTISNWIPYRWLEAINDVPKYA